MPPILDLPDDEPRLAQPNDDEYSFVKRIFEKVAFATNSNELGIESHISRDILAYAYILYIFYDRSTIEAKELLKYVGTDKLEELQTALKFGGFDHYMQPNTVQKKGSDFISFIFTKGVLGAVFHFIYGDESIYQLPKNFSLPLKKRPNSANGEALVSWLNELEPDTQYKSIIFLTNIFTGMGFTVDDVTDSPNVRIIHGTHEDGYERSFILGAFESFETITEPTLEKIRTGYDNAVEGSRHRLPYLLIVPSVGNGLRQWINKNGHVYCMWDLTTVHFLHMLGQIYSSTRKPQILHEFNKIFARNAEGLYAGLDGSACYVECEALMPLINLFNMRDTFFLGRNI